MMSSSDGCSAKDVYKLLFEVIFVLTNVLRCRLLVSHRRLRSILSLMGSLGEGLHSYLEWMPCEFLGDLADEPEVVRFEHIHTAEAILFGKADDEFVLIMAEDTAGLEKRCQGWASPLDSCLQCLPEVIARREWGANWRDV
jgi:hypothetical protein